GRSGCRTLTWPNESTTPSRARIRLAVTRSSSRNSSLFIDRPSQDSGSASKAGGVRAGARLRALLSGVRCRGQTGRGAAHPAASILPVVRRFSHNVRPTVIHGKLCLHWNSGDFRLKTRAEYAPAGQQLLWPPKHTPPLMLAASLTGACGPY